MYSEGVGPAGTTILVQSRFSLSYGFKEQLDGIFHGLGHIELSQGYLQVLNIAKDFPVLAANLHLFLKEMSKLCNMPHGPCTVSLHSDQIW